MHEFDEKRVHPRMKARWPVTILTEHGPVQGETVNIGATGAFVKCRGEFRKNQVYWMLIGFDRQSPMLNGKALFSPYALSSNLGERAWLCVRVLDRRSAKERKRGWPPISQPLLPWSF